MDDGVRPLVLMSSLETAGAERVTVSFLCRLAREGTAIGVCTVTGRHDGPLAGELAAAGVPRYDLRARRLVDPAAWLRLVRLLVRERVDVVHAHGQDASILAAAARRVARVPLVITRHVLEEPGGDWRERLRARSALAAVRRADAVVAVSAAVADRLSVISRVPRGAIRVIPNGIDLERFDRLDLAARRAELRRDFGFGVEDRVVLVPAVLRAGKGHEVLLEGLPRLRACVPSVRVVFAGEGEREAALRRMAAAHGAAVSFLGARQDIPELLTACDLVVLPSLAEGLPTALIEASAAGRPIVATRVGGSSEVVDDGRTGLLVPPGDPGALVEAIGTLLTDAVRAAALGEAARRRAHQGFSVDGQMRRTLALWAEVRAGARR